LLVLTPVVIDLVDLGWGLKICICNKFNAVDVDHTLRITILGKKKLFIFPLVFFLFGLTFVVLHIVWKMTVICSYANIYYCHSSILFVDLFFLLYSLAAKYATKSRNLEIILNALSNLTPYIFVGRGGGTGV
jgi:hypothetical protein